MGDQRGILLACFYLISIFYPVVVITCSPAVTLDFWDEKQETFFKALHSIQNTFITKTISLEFYYNIVRWTRQILTCPISRITKHVISHLGNFATVIGQVKFLLLLFLSNHLLYIYQYIYIVGLLDFVERKRMSHIWYNSIYGWFY